MFISAATWPGVLLPSSITLTTQDAVAAEIDLLRSSKIRASIFDTFHKSERSLQDVTRLNQELKKLDRYERWAFSRRRRALNSV
jgi:hypothetical protein